MVEEVKLFGFTGSPFSSRVAIALKLKGIEYEYIEEQVYVEKSPLLLKYNPVHKKIPVLLHNGKPIAESVVILDYIEEAWKSDYPILPTDPYHKAQSRFWAKFVEEKCLPAIMNACTSQGGEEREKAIEAANEILKTLENELNGKRFFGGETIGLVDIVANFIAYWAPILQEVIGLEIFTVEKVPKLFKWSEEFVTHNVVQQALPPKHLLVAFFGIRFGGGNNASK